MLTHLKWQREKEDKWLNTVHTEYLLYLMLCDINKFYIFICIVFIFILLFILIFTFVFLFLFLFLYLFSFSFYFLFLFSFSFHFCLYLFQYLLSLLHFLPPFSSLFFLICFFLILQVLSIGMKDLKKISVLIKEKNENADGSGVCAMHRSDALYSASNALEQVRH